MEPADSIRRLGFARWYERRLIESHAWLISAILCLILILTCLEELSFRGSVSRLLVYAAILTPAAAVCFYSVIRYQKILLEAEQLGSNASCSSCGAYARFSVISPSSVRCRKCAHEWRLIRSDSPG